MARILTGTDTVLTSPPFVAADGYTPAATGSTPTLAVTSAAGQTLTVGSVSATDETGVYKATVQAIADPDLLTATWTGAVSSADQVLVDEHQVVGGVYLTRAELWALPDLNKYGMERLEELRDEFEDLAERWVGHAFVRRFAQETIPYNCGRVLLGHPYPHEFVSVVNDDAAAVDVTDWTTEISGLVSAYNVSSAVTVKYVHGLERPPVSLKNACKTYVRSKALQDGNRVSRDMLSFASEAGLERYSTPDWNAGRPTGLLDVDRVLCSLGSPLPGVA